LTENGRSVYLIALPNSLAKLKRRDTTVRLTAGSVTEKETMEKTVLKDVFISLGELERFYENVVPVNLWRGLNIKRNLGLFDLIEKPIKMSNGLVRKPDITIENGWVRVKHWPRGISTFDRPGIPRGKDWVHYKIPTGTILPAGLVVVRDSFNNTFQATHYTIAPAYDMPLAAFKALLSRLAKNAIKEAK
jgi:hypothetical protein